MNTNQPLSQNTNVPQSNPDEINLLEYVYVLVKYKWWIIGGLILGMVIGLGAAYKKGPRWVATAVIAPKETENQKAPNFSAFGALGELAVSQLGLGGNASMDKINLIVGTKQFNGQLVYNNNLLPEMYRVLYHKVYLKYFDSTSGQWSKLFCYPDTLDIGATLKGGFIKVELNKNNTMSLTFKSKDSTFTANLTHAYLKYLDLYLRQSIQTDAHDNVSYIDSQLVQVADPLLREKLQDLEASEIEKAMVVSKQAFKVVDPPYQGKEWKEKKLYPLGFGIGLCFLVIVGIIFEHVFSLAEKTEEDRKLISKIKQELFRFFTH